MWQTYKYEMRLYHEIIENPYPDFKTKDLHLQCNILREQVIQMHEAQESKL